jgi:hypothetical protein
MSEDSHTRASESEGFQPTDFHVSAFLATLCAVYAVLLLVASLALDGEQLAKVLSLNLNDGLCIGGAIALLAAGGFMVERAIAARKSDT